MTMNPAKPLLRVDDIKLSFKGVCALDGVSLDVPQGGLSAVIGPNGAGKTSLFNCISGSYKPQGGQIIFGDRDITGLRPDHTARLGVARMFQNLLLFEHMTVLDNLMLGRHLHYTTHFLDDLLKTRRMQAAEIKHREKVEEIIDFLDLEIFRMHPVGILPYGVLKRVELGRALAMQPSLLLLDEPAAGLNQEETEDMARYILDIKEVLGVTQLLIEHELRFVFDLADDVTVLEFGRKIAAGHPSAVKHDPAVLRAYSGGLEHGEQEQPR